MADITFSSYGSVIDPERADIGVYIAGTAITKGQAVYIATNGTLGVAYVDTNKVNVAALQYRGIALNSAAAGQVVSVLHCGTMSGFDLDDLDVGDILYLSEKSGAIADTASVGTVDAVPHGNTIKKVFRSVVSWTAEFEFTA